MFHPEQTVAEIVSQDYRAAGVFKKHGLDFCCGGKKPVNSVCESHGLDANQLIDEINFITAEKSDSNIDYSRWPAELLINYIEHMHHRYVKEAIPRIGMYTEKVAFRHGETQPELVTIYQKFVELSIEMNDHMFDEENRVFPAIKKLIADPTKEPAKLIPMIMELEDEHSAAGNLMAEIRSLTNNFTVPDWACNTYRVAFQELEAFENDLHQHVHLENNILFPSLSTYLPN